MIGRSVPSAPRSSLAQVTVSVLAIRNKSTVSKVNSYSRRNDAVRSGAGSMGGHRKRRRDERRGVLLSRVAQI